ncbi:MULTISPECIES: hypothetical protein [Methylobacterium]|nr:MULTISPECIES: hypothetical protein [Methylobacterium]MBY0297660.1 hypothetical protein [Methylobacterium sp.]MDN3625744.1 hypothetical protein [Methylobacterium isbiliense]
MVALVLVLIIGTPMSDVVDDVAFHRGHDQTELVASLDAPPGGAETGDPGLAGHLHCGCHVLAILDVGVPAPTPRSPRPRYARVNEAMTSLAPDCLARPPRA